MHVQPPTVGPIIGYTTADQVRLWLRGDLQRTSDGYRRCFGVARIKHTGSPQFGPPQYVKLPPHFDMTGVCAFTGLLSEAEYEYEIGWFFADTELSNLDATQDIDWGSARTGKFRTGVSLGATSRSYAVGSCRYLLRLCGGELFDERGDKTFRSIGEQHQAAPFHGLVMVGDQIYADDLNFIGPDTSLDQYLERYRSVFGQPHLRKLMAEIPTYMILDDHEIEDNWPQKATNKDWLTLYPAAIHAYQIYQCSHSPLFGLDANNRVTGTLEHFWYSFQDGCCDWFFMDSRTERIWHENPKNRQMISRKQMDALLNWLGDGSGQVKMVVTSVPFIPDLRSENDDKWGGYLAERAEILDYILTNRVKKVVFVSGDVHCSFSAELSSPQDPSFKIISIVSSSFFWPYPHMDDGDFKLNGKLSMPKGGTDYQVGGASTVYGTDNFARLNIASDSIEISFFERKGKQLGQTVTRMF